MLLPAQAKIIKLYALDAALDLQPGLTKKDLLKAMAGHVIAEDEVMGTFQKQ